MKPKIELKKIPQEMFDDLQLVADTTKNNIEKIPLNLLIPYGKQPFKPYIKTKLNELAEDIKQNGVLSPIIVRPIIGGKFQILAGHNRVNASKLAGITNIPAIIKEVDDRTATLIMLNTNLNQRDELLPSEKAFAYKMQMEAMKNAGTIGPSISQIAENNKTNRKEIYRYIRLTYLDYYLLEMVDKKEIPFRSGVALSYLNEENQNEVLDYLDMRDIKTITLEQAEQIKGYKDTELNFDILDLIFGKVKTEKKEKVPVFKFPLSFVSKQLSSKQIKKIQEDEELLRQIARTIDDYLNRE